MSQRWTPLVSEAQSALIKILKNKSLDNRILGVDYISATPNLRSWLLVKAAREGLTREKFQDVYSLVAYEAVDSN
jgi:hypothetical protein